MHGPKNSKSQPVLGCVDLASAKNPSQSLSQSSLSNERRSKSQGKGTPRHCWRKSVLEEKKANSTPCFQKDAFPLTQREESQKEEDQKSSEVLMKKEMSAHPSSKKTEYLGGNKEMANEKGQSVHSSPEREGVVTPGNS
mmetsp:Transcript_24135/g.23739  ORF Transcript_24135/g.23739 Transcript_24135/m.23739 type:complete len:139 (+) Transcript_24135:55-471(+)|eukprot:CAMPEP_0170568330 /NCGR_PEP_ID=MMETSP0211-20121228/81109_1 /TAXON_ID=311385 /ORGANISM="Pseudokeronopsis sp., Strain OXSARD2" /LENGTH=138 /DNA_ID=CAMNT_0010890153 /DNA_START=417 /DNA_END=833 /DNA_ORIENTATION=-